jgi:exopolyphosphatase/guanosine-5'-triphosphate,3'-diphosphate pyrophosphatase
VKLKKFGAIDIGSNAMRLLISQVRETEEEIFYKKVGLVRLPIRLGQEAFLKKEISEETVERFINGMKAYQYLLKVHEVESFRACATSAMREAKNGELVVNHILTHTGIPIEIIDGKHEAELIFNGHFKDRLEPDSNYFYVDVGGGSTEITILSDEKIVDAKSFKVGTIRLLNDLVSEAEWKRMKSWVKRKTKELDHVEMIGSGGNINKLYKLTDKSYPRPLLYHELKSLKSDLSDLTYEQRISKYNLNPDRADVIVLAAEIYYSVMKWSDASILHVPKIGLTDGIVTQLYSDYKNSIS